MRKKLSIEKLFSEPIEESQKEKIVGDVIVKMLPLSSLKLDEENVRACLSENDPEIKELASSINARGLLQPLIVRRDGDGYKVIVGHRRYMALKSLGVTQVECKIFPSNMKESEVREIQLIENLQRKDLSPLEEARAYKRYLDKTGIGINELGKKLGIDKATISRAVKLLSLPAKIQEEIERRKLSSRMLREIISIKDKEIIDQICQAIDEGKATTAREVKEIKKKTVDHGQHPETKKTVDHGQHLSSLPIDQLKEFFAIINKHLGHKSEETFDFLSEHGQQCLIKVLQEWQKKREKA